MYYWLAIDMLEGKNSIGFRKMFHCLQAAQAFLLFENLDRSTWSKTLRDSRSAYASLKEHFLRDITHPDDLSAADPLADDETVSLFRPRQSRLGQQRRQTAV